MLFKEIVDARTDARTHARTDAGRRTLKDHKSSLEHFVLRWAKNITLKLNKCSHSLSRWHKINSQNTFIITVTYCIYWGFSMCLEMFHVAQNQCMCKLSLYIVRFYYFHSSCKKQVFCPATSTHSPLMNVTMDANGNLLQTHKMWIIQTFSGSDCLQ